MGTLLPRGQTRRLLSVTIPAQEFGEWTCLGDERSTTCDSGGVAPRHHERRECSLTEEYASLRLSPRSLNRNVNLLLFATTTGSRHVLPRVRLGTHPCSRTRRVAVLDVLDGAKAKGVEEYVSLPYSPPSSVYSSRLGPHTSMLKDRDCGRDSSRRRRRMHHVATRTRAPIPAQEFRMQADPPSLGKQMASFWLYESRGLASSNLHHWSRPSLSSPSHLRELLSR